MLAHLNKWGRGHLSNCPSIVGDGLVRSHSFRVIGASGHVVAPIIIVEVPQVERREATTHAANLWPVRIGMNSSAHLRASWAS